MMLFSMPMTLGCFLAIGQAEPEAAKSPANAPAEVAVESPKPDAREGLWPSPQLMKLMLQRWAEEACEVYDLDAEQREIVRAKTVQSWSEFLVENRADLQPLVNEFIEMRMDLKAPEPERVKDWADRALPVFDKAREQVHHSHDEFRKVLRPVQRAKFEVDALKMGAGMAIAEQKLKQWKEGEVDKDVFWEPLPAEREARRETRRRRREAMEAATEAAAPVDQIVVELGRWDRYVADFIGMFHLDEGQRTTALSCLSELKQRAIAHRDHRREDIVQLERQIESFTGSESALDELKQRLAELYGPIDEMFKELQTRLEGIPTTQQRAEHDATAKPEEPPSERPAGAGEKPLPSSSPPPD